MVLIEVLSVGVADSWAFGRSTCPRSREGSITSRTSFFSVLVSEMCDRMLSFAADKERGAELRKRGADRGWSGGKGEKD